MRRAAARHDRWRVVAHGVGGRFNAVIGDDRRSVVIGTKIEAGAGILLDVDLIGEPADLTAYALALRSRVLDLWRYRAAAAYFGFGMRHRKLGHLAGNRPALGLIGVEDGRGRPPLQMRRQ